jgi:hypothetical protein
MASMGLALGIVTRRQTPTPTTKLLTLQCQYFSTKFGISQLLSEVFLESVAGFITGDAKKVVVEGVAENRCSITNYITPMMPKIYYMSWHRYPSVDVMFRRWA